MKLLEPRLLRRAAAQQEHAGQYGAEDSGRFDEPAPAMAC